MENNGTKRDLENHMTALRGKVRRLPQGVEKQQAELIANQIKNEVPRDGLEFQAALMAGECLPVRKAIEEHSPQVWATLQAARAQMMGG